MAGFFSSLFGRSDAEAQALSEAPDLAAEQAAAVVQDATADAAGQARPDARTEDRLPIFTDYHVPIFGQPDASHAYYHGHIDGAFDGDSEAFLSFIGAQRTVDEESAALDAVRGERAVAAEKLEESVRLRAEVAAADSELALYREEESKAEEAFESFQKEFDASEAQWKVTRHHGSRLSAGLYGVAGVVFLVGDFVVSKQVVAQALRLPYEYERVLFALGIAALAFLVKIAYERLVERPFSEGRDKVFRYVIIGAAVLTLATLSVLGILRSQVVAEEEALTGASGQESMVDFDLSGAAETIAAGGDVVLNIWQVIGFVLTAILFAVAGAICMGVALVTFRDYLTIRKPIDRKLKDLNRDVRAARDTYQDLSSARSSFERTQAQRASRLTVLEAPSVLSARIAGLDERIAEHEHAYYDAVQQAREHSYRSGYHLAKQNLASVPLGTSMQDYYAGGSPSGDGATSNRPRSRRDRGYRRPFLALRDDIIDETL